ncbi:hypothetical protein EHM69_01840 [candidate division KSB1 bacterium]|nr:MAG: hypothetical protein EHM69_01840 [candidate division KSB1 bacterium]
MPLTELSNYSYRGARASVLIHEREMRRFLEVWRKAKARKVALPETDDPDYESLEHLLHHVFRAARGYMTWMCEKLALPDPQIEEAPPPERVESAADSYMNCLLEKWRIPLTRIDETRCSHPSYKSRWDMDYSIDSMLEHAVVHPMKHSFQLNELMGE